MLAFHDDPLIAAQHVLAGAPATHQELLGLIEGLVGVLEWLENENQDLIIERDALLAGIADDWGDENLGQP